tara:strand:- start:354 stop:461 length:108 start_codon:yes stop_codon:yes gene_type:complete
MEMLVEFLLVLMRDRLVVVVPVVLVLMVVVMPLME